MVVDEELKKFLDKIDPRRLSHRELAIRYIYLGEEEKAREEFNISAHTRIPKSQYDGLSERHKKEFSLLVSRSGSLLENGVELNLSKTDDKLARQLFEWASEVTIVSDDVINKFIEQKRFEYIAQAYLWRGYALIMLGKYDEALPILEEVVPYFVLYRKSFGRILWPIDYNLPRALIPLCEYKLNPNEENRKKTIKGLNDYIKSLEVHQRHHGYLYYFHLKDTFPDAYSSD